MFSAIGFAIKVIIAAGLVIPLFINEKSPILRDKIGLFCMVSIVSATIVTIADRFDSGGFIVAGLLIAIGIVSYSEFQKNDSWIKAMQKISPFWLSAVIGIAVGAGLFLQAAIITALGFFVINYLPLILNQDRNP